MYVDACILVKLLVAERDSEACAAKVRGTVLVSSELALAELGSALLQKERAGEIGIAHRDASWAEFERQIESEAIHLVPLDGAIIRRSRQVMDELHPRAPLRALDAIHLATYLSVITGPLFTKDRRMQAAARLLEIPLVE
jgi:predicted nucleic acid-binding protein